MLTLLSTVKSRLAILDTDTTQDALLTSAIKAVSARFDRECNRTLSRTENATFEFGAASTEVAVPCYPIESVQKFETKTSEANGWQELSPAPDFLIRRSCIISLQAPVNLQPSTFNLQLARVTYTGGYVLPGDPDPQPSSLTSQPVRLPDDLEQAAVEQVAYWFQNKDHLGLKTYWPTGQAYYQFADFDLLRPVQSVLEKYRRYTI